MPIDLRRKSHAEEETTTAKTIASASFEKKIREQHSAAITRLESNDACDQRSHQVTSSHIFFILHSFRIAAYDASVKARLLKEDAQSASCN